MSNRIILKTICKKNILQPVKLLVFDMAGTTIDEGGIVYKTLYDTIKTYNTDIQENDIKRWYGSNKYEVLDNYVKDPVVNKDIIYQTFNDNLKERYFYSDNIKLINNNLPILFNSLRETGIKIALNTGYNRDIQEKIIEKLYMKEFIDDYISSEDVKAGRPKPYMIEALRERNKIEKPKEVLKFGDTENDILEGVNAGCGLSIGVLSGALDEFSDPKTLVIKNISDIKMFNK